MKRSIADSGSVLSAGDRGITECEHRLYQSLLRSFAQQPSVGDNSKISQRDNFVRVLTFLYQLAET